MVVQGCAAPVSSIKVLLRGQLHATKNLRQLLVLLGTILIDVFILVYLFASRQQLGVRARVTSMPPLASQCVSMSPRWSFILLLQLRQLRTWLHSVYFNYEWRRTVSSGRRWTCRDSQMKRRAGQCDSPRRTLPFAKRWSSSVACCWRPSRLTQRAAHCSSEGLMEPRRRLGACY